uniref:CAP domain-containing protein n=1 Tax=Collinsella sp. BA40 TaxID=2560852 RepID=UPI00164FA422|nr:CAP domain-containing protein [Collinsella sp. BA40]
MPTKRTNPKTAVAVMLAAAMAAPSVLSPATALAQTSADAAVRAAATRASKANDALAKAQAELDAFLAATDFDGLEAAKREAQAAYDEALAAKRAADREYDEAKRQADRAQVRLDEEKVVFDAASAALPSLSSTLDAAKTEYGRARDAYAAAAELVDGGAIAASRAELQRAQTEYDAIEEWQTEEKEQARQCLIAARKAYNKTVERSGSTARAQADAAIAGKQSAYDAAASAYSGRKRLADRLAGEVTDLEGRLAVQDNKLSAAQKKAADARTAHDDAHAAVDAAQRVYDDALRGHEAWAAEYDRLVKAAADAKRAADNARSAYETASQTVKDLESQKAEKQKKVDELRKQMETGGQSTIKNANDFFEFIKNQGVVDDGGIKPDYVDNVAPGAMAQNILNGWRDVYIDGDKSDVLSKYTNLNDPNDASAIGNMLKALDLIAECNALRKAEGLPELYVSDVAMAIAIMNTNWSAANLKKTGKLEHVASHSHGAQGWAENINAGYTDAHTAYEGWYWNEKANALGHAVTDPATGKVYQPGGSGGQTGHYENIVEGSYTVTGAAWNATGFNGRPVMGQEFRDENKVGPYGGLDGRPVYYNLLENIYTVDAYRARLLKAIEQGGGNSQLQARIDQLLKEIDDVDARIAAQDLAGKKAARDAADRAKAAADKAVDDHAKTNIGTAEAKAKLDAAKAEEARAAESKRAAEAELARVRSAVEAEKARINQQLASKRAQLADARAQLPALEAAKNQAASELDAVRTRYAAITDSGTRYDRAKADLDAAQAAYAAKKAEVEQSMKAVRNLSATLSEARSALSLCEAAVDDAEADLESKERRLAEAKEQLDAATAERARLEAARDAARAADADAPAKKPEESKGDAEAASSDTSKDRIPATGDLDAAIAAAMAAAGLGVLGAAGAYRRRERQG